MRYTDNDIQDYLEGIYSGDMQSLETYLHETEEGKKRLAYFQSMFSMLEDAPVPSLNISLEEKVLSTLNAREQKQSYRLLWWITGGCMLAALASAFFFLESLSFFTQAAGNSTIILILVAAVILSLAFHGLDWYRQYRRYNNALT